jgi:hypothetical protein
VGDGFARLVGQVAYMRGVERRAVAGDGELNPR